jgi:hypothetical protein
MDERELGAASLPLDHSRCSPIPPPVHAPMTSPPQQHDIPPSLTAQPCVRAMVHGHRCRPAVMQHQRPPAPGAPPIAGHNPPPAPQPRDRRPQCTARTTASAAASEPSASRHPSSARRSAHSAPITPRPALPEYGAANSPTPRNPSRHRHSRPLGDIRSDTAKPLPMPRSASADHGMLTRSSPLGTGTGGLVGFGQPEFSPAAATTPGSCTSGAMRGIKSGPLRR